MKQFLALLTILCGALAGQSIIAPASTVNGVPATNLITVCSVNPGSGTCNSLVTTYTTIAITTACSGTGGPLSGTGCTNPGYSDAAGNIVAFAASGQYWCQYKATPVSVAYSIPCSATGGTGSATFTPVVKTSLQSGATSDIQISNAVTALGGSGIIWADYSANQTWAACPTFGSGNIHLVLYSVSYAVSVNCTIPSTVTLEMKQGAVLAPASGVTITHNGTVIAGDRQQIVNTTNGNVIFIGNNPIYAAWYGAIQNLTVDDAIGVQAALDNNPGKKILLSATANPLCTGGTSGSGCTGAASAQFLTAVIMRHNGSTLAIDTSETWADGGAWISVPNVLSTPAIWVNQNCYGCALRHIHVRGPNANGWNAGDLTTFESPASTSMSGLDNDGIAISGGLFYGEDIGGENFLRHGILICGDATCDAGQPDYWRIDGAFNVANRCFGMFVIGGDSGGGQGNSVNGRANDYGEIGDWTGAGGGGNSWINPGDELSARNLISAGTTQAITSCTVTSNVDSCTTTAANTFANKTWVTMSGFTDTTFNGTCRITSASNANPFTCNFTRANGTGSAGTPVVGTASTTSVWAQISATHQDGGSNAINVGEDLGSGVGNIQIIGGFGEPQAPNLGTGTIAQGLVNASNVQTGQRYTFINSGTGGYTVVSPTTVGHSNFNIFAVADQPLQLNLQSGITTDQNVQILWNGHNSSAGVQGSNLWKLGTVSAVFELVAAGGPAWAFQTNGVLEITSGPFQQNSTTVPGFQLNTTGAHFEDLYTSGANCAAIGGAPTALGLPSTATAAFCETGITFTQSLTLPSIATSTNCAAVGTAANPSVASCTAAAAGSVSCATNASTGTCTVNTTAVTANSEIFVQQRADTTTGTRLGVTCNTTKDTNSTAPQITAVTAATSFTFQLGTITTNPECFSYHIIN